MKKADKEESPKHEAKESPAVETEEGDSPAAHQHAHVHLHFGGDGSAVHQNPHAGFSRPPAAPGGVAPMYSASQQGMMSSPAKAPKAKAPKAKK